MMRKLISAAILFLVATSANAQFGDLLNKATKVAKGAKVAREATREFTEAEEADIGRVVAARVLKTYPMSKNEKLQRYVTLVGNTVASYSTRPTMTWHFAVVDSNDVNAFAAPAGFIFVTSGAMKEMHSEAELAALLGHEIAHVTQKHILKEVKRGALMSSLIDAAKESSGGSFLTNELGAKIGELATDKLFKTGLSRRDEQEADTMGVELAASAGYKAAEFLTFLQGLTALKGTEKMKTLTSTHPAPEDRIAYLKPKLKSDSGLLLADRWDQWTRISKK